MNKCCSLVSGFGGSLCDCVLTEACDAYLLYPGCTRLTELFEGLNTGSTGLSVIPGCANLPGPTEILHCKAANGYAIDEAEHTIVDCDSDYATV